MKYLSQFLKLLFKLPKFRYFASIFPNNCKISDFFPTKLFFKNLSLLFALWLNFSYHCMSHYKYDCITSEHLVLDISLLWVYASQCRQWTGPHIFNMLYDLVYGLREATPLFNNGAFIIILQSNNDIKFAIRALVFLLAEYSIWSLLIIIFLVPVFFLPWISYFLMFSI